MEIQTMILLSIPLFVIQVILIVINLLNIRKKKRTKTLTKPLWIIIILFTQIIGNIAYMILEGGHRHDSD